MTTASRPRIAIIGAGPAGCTLARLLHRGGVSCVVFESESTASTRSQGGTLDLHDTTGLLAIRAAGLYDEFLRSARTEGDAMKICDKRMRRWLDLGSSKDGSWFAQGKPEIDREALRQILLNSLPEGTVRWGKRVKAVRPEKRQILFEDGSEEGGWDLVVGADGVWSKVRSAVTDVKPFYSGVGGFTACIDHAEERAPEIYRLINRGSWFNISDGSMILGQQMGDGSVYVTAWQVKSEDWQKNASYDIWNGKAVSRELRREYKDWSPEILELLAAIDEKGIIPRNLYMLPVDFRWKHVPGATLLGDAAHVMTPFIGEGVNAAMKDAHDLALAITSSMENEAGPSSLDRSIKNFEESMFERVNKIQVRTQDMMRLMLFTNGAPGAVMERWMIRAMSDDIHPVLLVLVRFLVYIIYFFYKHLVV